MVSRWLGEWTGPYSDKSDEMTDELKEALNHEGKVHWEVGYKCWAGFAFRIVCLNMKQHGTACEPWALVACKG